MLQRRKRWRIKVKHFPYLWYRLHLSVKQHIFQNCHVLYLKNIFPLSQASVVLVEDTDIGFSNVHRYTCNTNTHKLPTIDQVANSTSDQCVKLSKRPSVIVKLSTAHAYTIVSDNSKCEHKLVKTHL